ncbi:hypothetical protein J6590_042479 [Homalodisca vitripennis]|nr:hypothetical protein J6590_042479 [Homalodisca vitripennis]
MIERGERSAHEKLAIKRKCFLIATQIAVSWPKEQPKSVRKRYRDGIDYWRRPHNDYWNWSSWSSCWGFLQWLTVASSAISCSGVGYVDTPYWGRRDSAFLAE